jgi:hypothetical protein
MLSHPQDETPRRLVDVALARPKGDPDARILADMARLEWLHSPSPIERLEAQVGRERLSQLLLLVALSPEEEDPFIGLASTQAA